MDRAGRDIFHQSPFDWDQRSLNAATVEKFINTPAINDWGKGLKGTPLELFLQLEEGSAELQHLFSTIEAICDNESLVKVLHGQFDPSLELVAWLHDKPNTREAETEEHWHTQKSLCETLSQKRTCLNGSNADDALKFIRRLYLPNRNFGGLAPILATASRLEARVLAEFLYKYATSESTIFASLIPSEFVLEFHIPYYIWMDSKAVVRDQRCGLDKPPLRQSWSLKFLSIANSFCQGDAADQYLYESKWSCVIVGLNKAVWTAYAFTDTYFFEKGHRFDIFSSDYYQGLGQTEAPEDEEPEDEEPEDEGDEDEGEKGYSRDPLSGKETLSLDDPREYFFNILNERTKHIFGHWRNNMRLFEECARQYIQNEETHWKDGPSTLTTVEDRSKVIKNSETWIAKLSQILKQLAQTIDDVCEYWDDFKKADMPSLCIPSESNPNLLAVLQSIHKRFTDLKRIQKRLENLMSQVREFKGRLELHLQVQNYQTILLQHFSVNYIQLISPPTLAAALMQTKVFPWQSGFWPWIIMTFVIWLATLTIKPVQRFLHPYSMEWALEIINFQSLVGYIEHIDLNWIPRLLSRRTEPDATRFDTRMTDTDPPSPTRQYA